MKKYTSKFLLVIIIFSLSFSLPVSLFAGEATKEEDVKENKGVDIYAVPPILDPEFRHRKRHQFEFSPWGGGYLGNTVGQTWVAGARGYYFFNNTYGIGASYGASVLRTDRRSEFGSLMTNDLMQIIDAEAQISTDAAFRVGKSLIEMDFFMTLGAGGMVINNDWQPAGLIGGGIKIYPNIPWLAFRIDVNSFVHYTDMVGKDNFDCDVLFLGGVSFLFPSHPSAYERK